jgi:hypothetical protein
MTTTASYLVRIHYQFAPFYTNLQSILLPWTELFSTTLLLLLEDCVEMQSLIQPLQAQITLAQSLLPLVQKLITIETAFTDQFTILSSWQSGNTLDPFFDHWTTLFTFMRNTVLTTQNYLDANTLINFSPQSIDIYTDFVQFIVQSLTSHSLQYPDPNTNTPLTSLSSTVYDFCKTYETLQTNFPLYPPLLQRSLMTNIAGKRPFLYSDSIENVQMLAILQQSLDTISVLQDQWKSILSGLVSPYVQN